MTVGEKARVWIEDPRSFGYGERGSFSFPAVPPLAELVYEVELVAFEPPEDYDDDDESERKDSRAPPTASAAAASRIRKRIRRRKRKSGPRAPRAR